MIHVTIYNEFHHERKDNLARDIYPEGIHITLKKALEGQDISVDTVTLDDIDELTCERLAKTDVLIWWGHCKHNDVPDEVAVRVQQAVLKGMGAIFLHSAHHSKPFKLLMGTPCNLCWRENGDYELLWVCDPSHPIAQGIDRFVKLDHEEVYSEPFTVPEPDKLVFISSFQGGEVFRAGCCYQRQNGKIFYFQPGHETYPTYHNKDIIRIIKNAVYWAAPIFRADKLEAVEVKKPLGE
ncbi:MAG: ThuA domain-containing protein [Clostridia bacterium]|nr:ThuA domain-containing protein [Clostridia bacterium]